MYTHEFQGHIKESKLGRATLKLRQGIWGPPWGPQWVQGKVLVGVKGENPQKLLDFRDFIGLKTCFDCWKPAIFYVYIWLLYVKKFLYKSGGATNSLVPPPLSYARTIFIFVYIGKNFFLNETWHVANLNQTW
jgi:hypothetical protein